MKLSLVIEQVRNGDTSGLSAKSLPDSTIVSYINLALIALYNRFQLRTEEAIVALETNRTLYKFDGTDPAVTVDGGAIPMDDIVSINEVFDEFGTIPINDNNEPSSVYSVSYDTLQVPIAETGMFLSVIYKATPQFITYTDDGNGNAVDVNIPLPLTLLEALLFYIAYRAYLSTGDAGTPDADKYEMKFTQACNKAHDQGLVMSDTYSINVEHRGYV